jgi:sterol desaturase/sphingolipid hydroxylase (fatty acid hydroxylase superfamily)
MEWISGFFSRVFELVINQFWSLLSLPFDSGARLYWLYLVCAVVFAFGVYRLGSNKSDVKSDRSGGFVSFLFPKSVWSNASAWLDLKFFIVNQFTGKLLYAGLTAAAMGVVFYWVTGGTSLIDVVKGSELPGLSDFLISILYMIVVIAITDFTAFYIHYLQHKIPLLWEFHKVHHSPEVMHPISNFREHPFDNVAYAMGIGSVYGIVLGGVNVTLGYLPNMPTVLGMPFLLFLFNAGGYHLRHSHIWLRWPGRWSMVFPSPAHHHVHHSCHPDHLDKNFAFLFPLWDVLFRTYHMPKDNRDVKFGIYGMDETEYTSVWKLYALPFRNIARKLKAGKSLTVNEEPRQDETERG